MILVNYLFKYDKNKVVFSHNACKMSQCLNQVYEYNMFHRRINKFKMTRPKFCQPALLFRKDEAKKTMEPWLFVWPRA